MVGMLQVEKQQLKDVASITTIGSQQPRQQHQASSKVEYVQTGTGCAKSQANTKYYDVPLDDTTSFTATRMSPILANLPPLITRERTSRTQSCAFAAKVQSEAPSWMSTC